MGLLKTQETKSVLILALVSAVIASLFSFLGAPFLRALAVSTRSVVFWLTATLLVCGMLLAGLENYKISQTAVYVGSILMTLGSYSELEKRGIRWRPSIVLSLFSGVIFALAGYFLILKNHGSGSGLNEIVEPLREAINTSFPQQQIPEGALVKFLPGIFIASLFGSWAFGFVFEAKVFRLFRIKQERFAGGFRWLEFRVSDAFIWLTLILSVPLLGFFENPMATTLGINFLIISSVVFFFQGMAAIEVMIRFYRLSPFMRTLIYLLVFLQLAPVIVFVGFVDHWADFRKLIRKKSKTN